MKTDRCARRRFMYYSDQVIEDVRSANNLVEVVSDRVQLAKKGKNYFGLCPFHNEKTPSFSVDPDRQYFYCYSCNKGGDAYRFIMETEKLSFPEAIQKLADRAGIVLPASSDPVYNKKMALAKELQERHFEMYAQAVLFFSQTLLSDKGRAARAYMQKRMIRADMVRRFGLGYAPPEWDSLLSFMRSKSYKDEDLLSGGLIVKGKNDGLYDRFRDRMIFPIQDVAGRVLAFGGRALDDSTPKYLNSPESQYYSKGKNLYGLNLAKTTKEKNMIIVEGYMDLISLYAHGIDNAIAPLGTALTDDQARLLKRYTDDVIIAFDADAAGQAAALRGLDILEAKGFRVKVLTIPDSKDPDEFIRAKGAAAFRGLISEALPLLDYKIGALRRKYTDRGPGDDVLFFKDVVRLLAGVDDEIEREIYVSRIAANYGITETSIKSEIAKIEIGRRGAGDKPATGGSRKPAASVGRKPAGGAWRPSIGAANAPPAADEVALNNGKNSNINAYRVDNEFFVIALLAIDNSLWDIVAERLPPEHFENMNARQALIYTCERASKGYTVLPGELMHYFSPDEGDYFAAMLTGGCHCEDNRRAMSQKIKDIHSSRANRQIRDILSSLESNDLSEQDKARLRFQLTETIKQSKPLFS